MDLGRTEALFGYNLQVGKTKIRAVIVCRPTGLFHDLLCKVFHI